MNLGLISTIVGGICFIVALRYVHKSTQVQLGEWLSRLVALFLATGGYYGIIQNLGIDRISSLRYPVVAYLVPLVFLGMFVFYVIKIGQDLQAEVDAIKGLSKTAGVAIVFGNLARILFSL